MKKIEEYTTEELVALYKRLNVYAVTWWFKYFRMYKMKPEEKDEPLIERELDLDESPKAPVRYFHHTKICLIDYRIRRMSENGNDHQRKYLKLSYQREALSIIDHCLYWFWNGYERGIKFYEGYDVYVIGPEEMLEDLHCNDDVDEEYGRATKLQVYEFVWNTLQYLDIKQLGELLKFAEKGLKCQWNVISMNPGRRSRNCEIRQIDIETGNVVQVYQSRNELIQKTGIKKSHLSQCIKTSKDRPYDREGWKKWIGKDERKYGFVEILK